jgi:hypothetical protein
MLVSQRVDDLNDKKVVLKLQWISMAIEGNSPRRPLPPARSDLACWLRPPNNVRIQLALYEGCVKIEVANKVF